MKKRIGQVFSLVFVVVLVIAMVVPACANVGDAAGYVVGEFWDMMAGRDYDTFGAYWKNFIGYLVGEECPSSPDKYHHGNIPVGGIGVFGSGGTDDNGKFVWHTCDYCGEQFKVYASDLQQSYEAQVEELPAFAYNADGSLLVYGVLDKCTYIDGDSGKHNLLTDNVNGSVFGDGVFSFDIDTHILTVKLKSGSSGFRLRELSTSSVLTAPYGGYYTRLVTPGIDGEICAPSGYKEAAFFRYSSKDPVYLAAGATDSAITLAQYNSAIGWFLLTVRFLPSVYKYTPAPSVDINFETTYNINSRPTSITGDYGIIGDNGQIIKVEGDKIVNETNNNYYNPVTGETSTITDWSYNYEDRSYTMTTESGDTVTITYGDEHVTIKEGDTIYNVYYLVDGSGSENPDPGPDVPPACDHTWTEASRTDPTCSTPGKVTSTCSKCSQTKTETIPATGHTWAVDRTVQTTYDEEGNLLQQGYTIYKCSVCGEQYKDMEGTGPPGSEEEKSIWEKIGDFFGTIGGGFIDIINAVFGKLLDALIASAEMLTDKLKAVVEAVLSIFEEVPAMFGGFLAFLTAMFPFLPPEIMTLLTFGIAAVVFIGIIKAIRR